MSNVPAGFVDWLKAPSLYTAATDSSVTTTWGQSAGNSTIQSPIALKSDAVTEAAAQQTFLEGPIVQDQHLVPGLQNALRGQCITLTGDRLGYSTGAPCFVIATEEQETEDMTLLTVLRRL